ncbi:TerC family protein [Brevibacillus sp. NPDC003359]|uniref:TerC family protein n=1 Tax=unclassified Brevibacillus TaxID=2684853 RepID=UPI003682947C
MDLLLTPEFWTALLSIIIIDLVLAGDNALVIGMAARNLPAHQQKQAIIWGTVGAIVIRALATLAVVWLLKIPGLLLVGGLILIWIALKLLTQDNGHDNMKASGTLGAAIWTIIVADTVMGLDNVIAVAGAAHGDFLLVVIGLIISVPIMVWGSTLILKLIEKYPVVIYIGSAVLAYTAAGMVTSEKFLAPFFASYPWVKWVFIVAVVVGVLLIGRMKSQQQKRLAEQS